MSSNMGYWVGLALGLLGTIDAILHWNRPVPYIEALRNMSPGWRGFIRGLRLGGPELLLLMLYAMPLVLALDKPESFGWRLYRLGFILLLAVLVVLELVIFLFNRPRFLVPKRFWDERGALHEWRSNRSTPRTDSQ